MTGAPARRPRVLCVDDEPHVLEGLKDLLRRECEVLTTTSGFEALRLAAEADVDVVVTDMRMPQLDGAKLLGLLRRHAPLATRVVLTGESDVEAAARAVNDGGCHRFLQKPVGREELLRVIRAGAAERHRRQVEHDVLEHTVGGVVAVLGELLGAAQPAAQGASALLLALTERAAAELDLEVTWVLRAAASLAPLGGLLVPGPAAVRLEAAARMLAHIPRFEEVAAILSAPDPPSLEAQLLRGAVLVSEHEDAAAALARLRSLGCPPEVVDALAVAAAGLAGEGGTVVELRLGAVEAGMVLADEVRRADGTLLIARGVAVGPLLAGRLRGLRAEDADRRVLVRAAAAAAPAAPGAA